MGCFFNNGNNCSWIIILIIIWIVCGNGCGNNGYASYNNNGCGNDCGCNNCGCC